MRAICVNTSKPRMLRFFVHYLESVIVDHCTTRPCWIPILWKARWPGFVDNLDEVLVDNIAKTEAIGYVAMNGIGFLISNVNSQSW